MSCREEGLSSLELILVIPLLFVPLWMGLKSVTLQTYRIQLIAQAESLARHLSLTPASQWPSDALSTVPLNSLLSNHIILSSIQYSVNCYNAQGQLFTTGNCTISNPLPPTYIEVKLIASFSNQMTISVLSDWLRYAN